MRTSRTLTVVGLCIIIAAFTIWALHIIYPDLFPAWVDALFYILGGLGALLSVAGSVFADLLLPIFERSKADPDLRLEHLLKLHAPIRQTSYEELLARLGNSGRIPWLDRHISSTNVLLEGNRIAIIGPMKSGKTREAVELIGHAKKNGLITSIFEPTASLDLIPIDRLHEAVGMHAERTSSLFFIDELGLWQSDDDLERIAICIDTIAEVRPNAYILVTLQYERLTPKLDAWLIEHRFQRLPIPSLTSEQRLTLVQAARRTLNVNIDDDAADLLAHSLQVTKPWDIVSVLQSAPLHNTGAPALDLEQIQAILSQSQDAIWKGQRQELIDAQPAAAHLLDAIATFVSAGVTPRASSICRYAEYHMQNGQSRGEKNRSLTDAAERLRRFDIVSVSGNYAIPEPRLLPLIIDRMNARSKLSTFSSKYKPHLGLRIFQLLIYPAEVLGKKEWVDFFERKPFSYFKSWVKYIFMRLLPILTWQADKALLLQELGHPTSRTAYLSSTAFWAKATVLFAQANYDAALVELDHALALYPENTKILDGRGLLFILTGQLDKALHDIERAIKLNPNSFKAVNALGLIYDRLGTVDQALAQYAHAIQLNPTYEWPYTNRGGLLVRLQRYDQALLDLNKALDLNPQNQQAIRKRGLIYWGMKQYEAAISDLTKAIYLSPKSPIPLIHRSCIYLIQGDMGHAYTDVYHAIQLDSANDWAYGVLALIDKKSGNHDACQTHIARAIEYAMQESDPNRAFTSHLNLAFYYLIAGNQEKAEILYRETLHGIPCRPELAAAYRDIMLYQSVEPDNPLSQTIIDLITAIITSAIQKINEFGKDVPHAH